MADTKFMNFAEATPGLSDSVLVANNVNGVRRTTLEKLKEVLGASAEACGGITAASLEINGYVMFGNSFMIQWGKVTMGMLSHDEMDNAIRNVALPIRFRDAAYHVIAWDDNPENDTLRIYKTRAKNSDKFQMKVLTYNGAGVEVTPEAFSMSFLAFGR